MMEKRSLFSIIFALLISTFIVKVLNFLKELQISYFYGTSDIIDHFNIIMIGPNISLSTIAPAFGLILVSYLSNEKNELSLTYKELIFFSTTIISLIIIAIVSQINYGPLNAADISLSVCISLLFMCQVISVYYLHSFNAFNEGSISSIIQIVINLLVVSFSIFVKSYGLLLIGLIMGLIVQFVYLFAIIRKRKFESVVIINNISSNSGFYHSFFSVVLGYGLIEVLISIQKTFAISFEVEGLISAISYSYKVMNLPISIFLFAVLSVLFPKMTKTKDMRELDEISKHLLSSIAFVMIPFTVLLFWHADFITSTLFGRGKFDEESVILTAFQLKSFSLMLIPLSVLSAQLRVILVKQEWGKIYYSALLIIIISMLVNYISLIYSNLLLFSLALPIAYSITIIVIFNKSLMASINRDLIVSLISAGTIIMLSIGFENFLHINFQNIISITLVIFVYLIMQYLLKSTLLLKILRK